MCLVRKPIVHPYIPILIGVISVALSAIFVKFTAAEAGVTAFYRMFFSVLVLSPVFLLKYRREVRILTRKDWLLSTVAGVFLAFHFITWFESLNYTSVASSTVLVTLQPIFAFIGTYFFFKEKVSLKAVISAMIALTGSFVISWGDFLKSDSSLIGDILALIGCAFVTIYLLVGQEVRKRLSLITYTFIVYTISALTLLVYVLSNGESLIPPVNSDWLWFILLAFIPNLLGHSLFNWSLRWVSTNVISIAILFEPIGASILAYYLLQESLTASQLFGGSIIIIGITLFIIDFKSFKKYFHKKLDFQ